MIRIERHPNGPRVYVFGKRVHHGLAALIALPIVWRFPLLRTASIAALIHDLPDAPFRDCDNH